MGVLVDIRDRRIENVTKVIAAIGPDRDAPIYGIKDVARIVGMHPSTLRYWLQETVGHRALIEPADPYTPRLSFNNLAEAHLLQVTKGRSTPIPIARSRAAVETLRREFPKSAHPLLEHDFLVVPGLRDLFIRQLSGRPDTLKNLSRGGMPTLPAVLDGLIERLKCDSIGPVGLTPTTTDRVVVDLRISGGQPVVKGTGVLASVIARRYKAGDSPRTIAQDYRIKVSDVQEVIRIFKAA